MAKIVIIGSSVGGHGVAVNLRAKDSESEIILITGEPYLFYDRRRLSEFLAGAIKEKELFLATEDFYRQQKINFLKEKKVTALSIDKRVVSFKEKEKIEYDFLVIASGRKYAVADIPGSKKDGVYTLNALEDYKDFVKRLIIHPICVVGSDESALGIARAVESRFKVEVKLITGMTLDASSVPPGIEVINSEVQEVIGEGEAQAVKLKEGKVVGVSCVIFKDTLKSNIEFLKNTRIEVADDYILTDGEMRTNSDRVFALGSLTSLRGSMPKAKTWDEVVQESTVVADNLIKQMRGETCPTY